MVKNEFFANFEKKLHKTFLAERMGELKIFKVKSVSESKNAKKQMLGENSRSSSILLSLMRKGVKIEKFVLFKV